MTGPASPPDPRPRVVTGPGGARVAGWRCSACRYPVALPGPWCPRCRAELVAEEFGPGGVVWSATVLRVPLPDRRPPTALAYVDLDDGPRVLAHVGGSSERRLSAGTRVRGIGLGPQGDLLVEAEVRS